MDFAGIYQLQELEMKENDLNTRIKKIPQLKELKQMKAKFEKNQHTLEDKKKVYQKLCRSLKQEEDRSGGLEAKAREMDQLLYGGSINNLKELESLQQQLQQLKEQISEISEKIIEFLEEKERLDQEVLFLSKDLKEQYQNFQTLKESYQRIKMNMEGEQKGIIEDKENLLAEIDPQSLSWYQEKKPFYAGAPLAKIMENHACSWCGAVVPFTMVKKARENTREIHCENCGRRLHA